MSTFQAWGSVSSTTTQADADCLHPPIINVTLRRADIVLPFIRIWLAFRSHGLGGCFGGGGRACASSVQRSSGGECSILGPSCSWL